MNTICPVMRDLGSHLRAEDQADREAEGREEWIAAEAIEVRCDQKKMRAAIDWLNEEIGADALLDALAAWGVKHWHCDEDGKAESTVILKNGLAYLADRYTAEVLFPAHLERMKRGY